MTTKNRTTTVLTVAAAIVVSLTLTAASANAGIISTTDSGGTFTVTTNIALTPTGTVGTDGFGAWGDPGTKLNNGTWAWSSTEGFHSDNSTHPTRIYVTWAQDYEIDKIGLVHAEVGNPGVFVNADYLLQSLNSGGNPTVDGDWTTIGAVTGNLFTYPEYTIDPVTTSGIRLYITNPGTAPDQLARFEEILVQGELAATGTAPEPSTLILAALGLVGLVGTRRRRNR